MISKLPHLQETIFTTMNRYANESGSINLSQGFPSFDPDPVLLNLIAKFTLNGSNQYAPMAGLVELRDALAEKIVKCYKVNVHPEKEVTIVSGATQAIFSAVTAVVSEGDEVVVLEPAFDSYDPAILLNKGIPVHVPLKPISYAPDWELIESRITKKSKMIITNTPHNPSGYVWTKDDLEQLARLVEKHNLWVISDEVYEHIVFDGRKHFSFLMNPILRERTFVCGSFGKTFHITGWKIGYCVAPAPLTVEFRKIHQFVTFSTVRPIQHALAEYLQAPANYETLSVLYQEKRDLFCEGLKDTPFKFEPAEGSFFQQVRYGHLSDISDKDLAIKMTKELKVACIPVSSFYADGRDDKIIRFCFAKKDEEIHVALDRLKNFIQII